MKLTHVFYAIVALAAVSGIALTGPTQADERAIYIAGGAAR